MDVLVDKIDKICIHPAGSFWLGLFYIIHKICKKVNSRIPIRTDKKLPIPIIEDHFSTQVLSFLSDCDIVRASLSC